MRLPPWIWRIVRSRRVRIGAIWAGCLIPIAGVGVYHISAALASRAEEKQIARLRASGIATDWNTWALPAVSPEQDVFAHPAAVDERNHPLLKGFQLMDIPGFSAGFSRASGGPTTESDLAIPARLVDWVSPSAANDKEAALQLLEGLAPEVPQRWADLREAWSRPRLSWQVSSLDDLLTLQYELQGQVGFASHHALCELAVGRSEFAIEDIRTLLRMQRHLLVSNPNRVSGSVASTAQRGAWDVIWEGVVRGSWSDAQLSSLDQALVESAQYKPTDLLRGEVVRWIDSADLSLRRKDTDWMRFIRSDWSKPSRKLAFLWGVVKPHGLVRLDQVRMLDRFASALLSELPPDGSIPPDFHRRYRYLNDQERWVELDSGSRVRMVKKDYTFYMLWLFSEEMLSLEARRNLLRTGIALERFRLAQGSYPDRLDQLVPAFLPGVLPDPFDGQPLRYRTMADGSPRMWSIGPNVVDDGGFPRENGLKGDMVWITRPIPGYTRLDYRD